MLEVGSGSVTQTQTLARAVAGLAQPGDLLVLVGDLGAGKTAFTQGLGEALGVRRRITSPTFTLHNQYLGTSLTLHHLDVYRLEQLEEVVDLGLAELLDGPTLTVIEWGDTIVAALPSDYLEVRFEFVDPGAPAADATAGGDDQRLVTFRCIGPRWAARRAALARALGVAPGEPSC